MLETWAPIAIFIIPVGLLLYLPVFIVLALVRRCKRRRLGVPGPPWYLVLLYLGWPIILMVLFLTTGYDTCEPTQEINLGAISYSQATYKTKTWFLLSW